MHCPAHLVICQGVACPQRHARGGGCVFIFETSSQRLSATAFLSVCYSHGGVLATANAHNGVLQGLLNGSVAALLGCKKESCLVNAIMHMQQMIYAFAEIIIA